ncbi:hypothetical protein D9M68_733140 [compost metagenome]
MRIDAELPCLDLRIVDRFGHRVDRTSGNTRLLKAGDQFHLRSQSGLFRDQGAERFTVLHPRRIRRVGRMVRDAIEAEHAAKRCKLPVIAAGDDEMPICCRKYLIGNNIGMRIAHATRHCAGCEIVHRLIGEHRNADVEQR